MSSSWLSAFQDDHSDVHHKGSLAHDAVAGAVAYEAVKAYEDHVARKGQPDNHATAKKVLAGFAAAAFTHLAETKGLDAWDAHKQKKVQQDATSRVQDTVLVEQYSD